MSETIMNSIPVLSIVIPAYKAEKTIERCVRSIQANRDISCEIILVDDGSPDRTGELCDRLAREDQRIRVIHQENGGPGMARNTGMEAARGRYLAFVDADDTVAQTMYPHMLSLAEQTGADVVVCGIESILANGSRYDCHVFGNQTVQGKREVFDRIVTPLITTGHPDADQLGSGCNKLYRMSLIREHGLRFTTLRCAEDWLFSIECFKYASCVAFTEQCLYRYERTTEGSLSKTVLPDSFENRVWIQQKLAALFPGKYTEEYLFGKLLCLQQLDLNYHVNAAGWRGFGAATERIFRSEALREACRMPFTPPRRCRFARWCILNDRKTEYLLWGVWITKGTFVKYFLRNLYNVLKK